MKAFILMTIASVLFILSPVKSTSDSQEELKFLAQQSPNQREHIRLVPYKERVAFEVLSDELLLTAFRFLTVPDLGRTTQVSQCWKRVTDDRSLWRYMGARYYGDYLSEEELRESPKQKVICHYLSVVVNATGDLERICKLVGGYQLTDLVVNTTGNLEEINRFVDALPFKKICSFELLN